MPVFLSSFLPLGLFLSSSFILLLPCIIFVNSFLQYALNAYNRLGTLRETRVTAENKFNMLPIPNIHILVALAGGETNTKQVNTHWMTSGYYTCYENSKQAGVMECVCSWGGVWWGGDQGTLLRALKEGSFWRHKSDTWEWEGMDCENIPETARANPWNELDKKKKRWVGFIKICS